MSDNDRVFSVPSIHFGLDHVNIDGKKIDLWTLAQDVRIDRSKAGHKTVTLTIHADNVTIADGEPEGDDSGDFQWMREQITRLDCDCY